MFFFYLGIIIIVWCILVVLIVIKNELAYENHKIALRLIYSQPMHKIDELVEEYEKQTYYSLLFHPLKWTFESMFPGLRDKVR